MKDVHNFKAYLLNWEVMYYQYNILSVKQFIQIKSNLVFTIERYTYYSILKKKQHASRTRAYDRIKISLVPI